MWRLEEGIGRENGFSHGRVLPQKHHPGSKRSAEGFKNLRQSYRCWTNLWRVSILSTVEASFYVDETWK